MLTVCPGYEIAIWEVVGVGLGDWHRKPNSNNVEHPHYFLVSIRVIIKLRNELYISQ